MQPEKYWAGGGRPDCAGCWAETLRSGLEAVAGIGRLLLRFALCAVASLVALVVGIFALDMIFGE